MQRLVRSSLVGALTIASLAACGDKVTVTQPPSQVVDNVVHSVTVSPAAATVAVGQTTTLAASVDAGAGVTVRTVTWKSSDATIATVDASGKVTGVKAGSTSIIATSAADVSVSGAANVTVTGGGTPTVTISSINQTVGNNSVPANLSNAAGQLDITLNVEPNGQIIKTVTATIACGADTASASQTVSDLAPVAAEASAVPIQLSINTAAFSSAGVPKLHNGNCTLSAVATTGTGSQSATNTTPVTLNNTDVVIVKTANSGNTAADANGQPWVSGNITVSATPVLYSGATIANLSITLPGAATPTQSGLTLTNGVASATWSASSSSGASVKGLTLPGPLAGTPALPQGVHPTVLLIDAQGNNVSLMQGNSLNESDKRIDNQAPVVTGIVFNPNTQNTQNGWMGANFKFEDGTAITLDAAAKADNGGSDKVAFTTQWAPTGTTTWTTFASPTELAETSTSVAYDLRLAVCDAVKNCANTGVLTTFGIDKTKPSVSRLAGPKDQDVYGVGATIPAANFGLVDTSSTSGVSGSGPGPNGLLLSIQGLNPNGATGSKTTCAFGTPTGSGSAVTCKAPAASPQGFAMPAAATTAGEYTMVASAVDQAGNTSDAITIHYYVDQLSPAAPTGGVTVPGSIVSSSSFSAPATDSMDVAAGNGNLQYGIATFLETGSASPAGATFDNALVRSSTATVSLGTTFYRSLAAATGGAVPGTVGATPSTLGLRVIDAANNLSTALPVTLPAANFSTPVAISNNSTVNGITNFAIDSITPTAPVAAGAAVTFYVNAKAFNTTSGNPLTQVCFFFQAPNGAEGSAADASGAATGELVKIGCSSTAVATGDAANRYFLYQFTWTPPARFQGVGVGGTKTTQIQAVGSTSAGDALITDAKPLTIKSPTN